jgi:hypothetical protein
MFTREYQATPPYSLQTLITIPIKKPTVSGNALSIGPFIYEERLAVTMIAT